MTMTATMTTAEALAQIQSIMQASGVDAESVLAQLEASQPQVTSDLYPRFLAYIDASEKTVQTYTRALRQFSKWIDERGITRPTRADIIEYREDLKKTHKPSTVQGYMVAVRLFFQWTALENLYPNVAEHIKGAKVDNGYKRDALTARQLCKVLHIAANKAASGKLEDLRNRAILTLLAFNGLRTVEIIRANIDDFRTRNGEQVLYVQGKGREERTEYVRIEAETEDAIRDYLVARGVTDKTTPLFASCSDRNNGARMTTHTISQIAKNALVAAGYDDERLTAHSFRHTFCTIAAQTCDLIAVQEAARHTKRETTEIYVHTQKMLNNPCSRAVIDAVTKEEMAE